jgi:hypothetical protein
VNLPPPPASPPAVTLPPPPADSGSPASPRKGGKDKKKDKKDKETEKAEKAAEKAAEKDKKKAEKEAKKSDKKSKKDKPKEKEKDKEKDKEKEASAPNSPAVHKKASSSSLSTPSDSSSEPLSKEERKKREEEAEELSFSATFDKTSFLFNRIKNFPAIDQLEGKYRMKTTAWADRYLVLFCDFILYYEPKGTGQPRDFDKPLGALPLDRVVYKRIKDFEERMELSGLIPKTIMYDFCFELPVLGADGKERIVLLQFDRTETQKAWRDRIKSQAKNIEAMKGKVTPELKNTIDVLMNKYPLSHRLKEAPYPGDEEKWIQSLKDHMTARSKYRKDLRRAQLFSDFYIPTYKAYVDWFVTSGGEAGVASLEKEVMIAEDSVVSAWKSDFCGSINAFENEIDSLDKENEAACRHLLTKVQRKLHLIKMHIHFHNELYPNRDHEQFEEVLSNWKAFEDLLNGYIDAIIKGRMDDDERRIMEAEEAIRQAERDHLKREEERRNDPFGGGDDDDPFADTKVIGI